MQSTFLRKNYIAESKGMTMAEIVVAMGILSIVMVAVYQFNINVFRYNANVSGSLETTQDAEIILTNISRQLRTMSPGANGSYPLVNAATSTITFFADVDGNGVADQVRYFMVGTVIKKGITAPTGSPYTYNPANEVVSRLVSNIRNSSSSPVFQYYGGNYDGNDAELAQPVNVTSVRLIRINLTLDIDPSAPPDPRVYTTQVTLRNLKDNL